MVTNKTKYDPDKVYSGTISYRTTPQTHAILKIAAILSGKRSLNAFIDEIMLAQSNKILEQHKL